MATTTPLYSQAHFRGSASSTSGNYSVLATHLRSCTVFLPRLPCRSCSTLTLARRRNNSSAIPSSKKKKNKEDAIEALFAQLEEDLKNDDLSIDDTDDDEISEEDLAKLEQELAEALEGDDELLQMLDSAAEDLENDDDDDETKDFEDDKDEDSDDEEDEEVPIKLKNWQLKRLASALKVGRRKTSIKNLAAELCLDRAVVLELLREPTPELLMMSATLPDKPVSTAIVSEAKRMPMQDISLDSREDSAKPKAKVKAPVHVMQRQWSAQKRLKKVHVQTLEKVHRRSKRPTNAMISSIVHVTNLPRKKIVKWFEDRRAEDGVPDRRSPFIRSASETAFS
ncbi:hypothetical protein RJ641_022215 [Dillenia turbinata]|uniref:Homeobox domain-containing protein n=1 Tax=Dillenia turbinata TaxID=194707 RepID=A0AAN8YRH4_9MAGN